MKAVIESIGKVGSRARIGVHELTFDQPAGMPGGEDRGTDRCAEMERHLEGCARCRGTCDSLKRTLALCRTVGPSAPVPAAVQASVRTALRSYLAENA